MYDVLEYSIGWKIKYSFFDNEEIYIVHNRFALANEQMKEHNIAFPKQGHSIQKPTRAGLTWI